MMVDHYERSTLTNVKGEPPKEWYMAHRATVTCGKCSQEFAAIDEVKEKAMDKARGLFNTHSCHIRYAAEYPTPLTPEQLNASEIARRDLKSHIAINDND